jgi:methionyl-tRNA formyltransferase
MKNEKLKIVFMGTPEFGAIILKALCESEYKPILVVTAPDKPVGREQILTPPPVKVLATRYKISIIQPEQILNSKSEILNLKPDLIAMAAYGQILPKEILEIPKYGCLNVHPSLLPKYRGPSPIQYAILNGDKETGVTIVLMDEKMDHGPILAQRKLEIEEDESAFTLHDKLANLGASLLIETISKWQRGLIKPQPQDERKAIYTKILTREDGRIIWKKTAQELEREVRAFSGWPGSFTFWEQKGGKMVRIKILKARVLKSIGGVSYPIGKTLVVPQNEIGVQCGSRAIATIGFLRGGDFLVIEKLQMEGKEEMSTEEFLRGHPDFIGTILK